MLKQNSNAAFRDVALRRIFMVHDGNLLHYSKTSGYYSTCWAEFYYEWPRQLPVSEALDSLLPLPSLHTLKLAKVLKSSFFFKVHYLYEENQFLLQTRETERQGDRERDNMRFRILSITNWNFLTNNLTQWNI